MLELLIVLLLGVLVLLFGPRAAVLLFAPMLLFAAGMDTAVESPDGAPPMTYGVMIDTAHITITADGGAELHVTGYFPDGCDFPVQAAINVPVTVDGEMGNVYVVTIGRIGPADAVCPDVVVPYEDTIPLDYAIPPGAYTVAVNGLRLAFVMPDPVMPAPDMPPDPNTTPLPPAGNRSYAVVEEVGVAVFESYPFAVMVAVTGYHIDGCELPVYIEQRRNGNRVDVDIFRVMVSPVPCPDVRPPFELIIWLNGDFVHGTYTIRVNEYVLPLEL